MENSVPVKVKEGGIGIDVDRNIYTAFPLDGNKQRKTDFMVVSGLGSSAWENMILESFFNVPSVSAAKLLKRASSQGIPIYTIDSDNMFSVLPQLGVADEVVNDIQNAINAGKEVIISKTDIQYNDWNGVGYIVLDPSKGSGAYMISTGTAGSSTTRSPDESVRKKSDWSAFVTILTRQCTVEFAMANLGTSYVWGAKVKPECGFDCSGFVHYVFTTVYGKELIPAGTAATQYKTCSDDGWTLPYSERLPGDILWASGKGHTGIYYGNDLVIHASGRKCRPNEPNSWLPSETLSQECTQGMKIKICGYYRMVVITDVESPYFSEIGVESDICRPLP